jgi:hypothetical protein
LCENFLSPLSAVKENFQRALYALILRRKIKVYGARSNNLWQRQPLHHFFRSSSTFLK